MKKLKLTNKGKKLIGVLAAVASLLIILLVFIILSINKDTSKIYKVDELDSILIGEYEELRLKQMDQIDLLNIFGINKEEIPNSTLLMSYEGDVDGQNKSNDNYIIIINSENYQYYYDMLSSQVDSVVRYSEDPEKISLYDKAIIKCGENYVYLIISEKAEEIEQLINE